MVVSPPVVVGVFLALLVVVGAVLFVARRTRGPAPRDAGPVPVSPRFRDLIARLGDPDTREEAAEALAAAGADAVPDLLAALSDVKPAWDDEGRRLALAWTMDVLARIGDPRARPALEPHILRETRLGPDAMCAYAALGSDDVVELTAKALAHGEAQMASGAVYGARRAGESGRATASFRARIAPLLAGRVGQRIGAAAALLALDPGAAPLVLTSGAVLGDGTDSVVVEEVFGALADARATVDGAVVISCLERFAASPTPEAHGDALVALARALAASGHPESRVRLGRLRASQVRPVRRAALAGLLVLEGLWRPGTGGGDLDVELAEDPAAEPSDARRTAWYALTLLESHGLAAFLRTPAGRSPAAAAAALRSIGAEGAASAVEAAAAQFRGGVPTDDAERARRLDAAEASGSPFLDLDERVTEGAQEVEDGLRALLLDHAAEFRRAPA